MRSDMGGVGIEFDVHGSGRPVLLLHGFPDTGRVWRNQVPALVDAGFQVIVPDLRGFGRSGKPEDVDAYGIPFMLQDVSGILAAVGAPRAHIVGHDWGAALAWAFAHLAPDQVDHLVALSVGTPGAFAKAGFAQREKSWYMLLFQFAGIAEQWLSTNNWANMREWGGHPDHDAVVGELEASGSLTPGLNWYRANVPPEVLIEGFPDLPPVQAPTMGLWSTGDRFLTEAPMVDSGAYVVGPWRYERVEGASHWMQLDRPDVINQLLIDFLPA